MKRALSIFLALILLASIFAGCSASASSSTPISSSSAAASGPNSSEASQTSGRTNITVMLESAESGEPYQIWSQLYADYLKEAGLNLEIEWELLPNDDDYFDQYDELIEK